jgi:gliding motility-associated-like protein
MKKLLLLLFMFAGFSVFGQLSENFEGATFPPTGWTTFETGTGATYSWAETNLGAFTYGGVGKSAIIRQENVATGQAIDWMVTSAVTVPANGQLRFYTKTIQTGVQGSLFDIKISATSQTNTASFTNLVSYDEASLTAVANVYEEKVIDIPATYPVGSTIYIAFVMTNDNGDRWLIDNVNVAQKCNAPIGPLGTANESTTTAQLSWGNPGGITAWEIEVVPFASAFTGVPTYTNVTTNPFTATGLLANTLYKFQVRSVCANGFVSDWFGPRSFQTASLGDTCAGPIVVGTLPYQTVDDTANYLDLFDTTQPLACSGSAANYMAGNDVFYSYTATFTGNIAISMSPTNVSSSIHVYSACPGTAGATCLAGAANPSSGIRDINPFPVVAGTTYYIIISSSAAQQTVGYTLTIQQVFCNQPTALAAAITSPTTANLSWTSETGVTSWQYSVGAAPYGLPTGTTFTSTTSNTTNVFTGIPGIVYQYYVRADCNNGYNSIWSGPFSFTMPQVATPLNFIDGLETLTGWTLNNGSQPNKWAVGTGVNNGGTHALYITDTNGTTNTYNNTATSIVQAYKDFVIPAGATQLDFTFDWRSTGEALQDYLRVWTVPGTYTPAAGSQITAVANSRIKIGTDFNSISNFTTQNYTLNATPYAGGTMRVVFEWRNNNTLGNQPPAAIDNIKLNLVTCPKPGNLTISNIFYNAAQVNWTNGAAETQWEVLVLPTGAPAPNAASVGVVTNGNPFSITGLTSVTCYDVYVRSRCSSTEFSFWSVPVTFCTTPNFCAGDHYTDTGGTTGAYQNNENTFVTICPANVGDVVTVVFNSFDLAAGDNLIIRNGDLPTSPIVGTYSGTTLPPSFTSTSPTGCLYLSFTSNTTGTATGWDATIFCTQPITCFKPTAVTVSNVTGTTASVSWTESGSATQWQIIALPVGSNVPALTFTGVNATSPFLLTGLNPSSTYTFYVKAICSSSNFSFWSDGVNFTTTPLNDLCSNATVALLNDDLNCTILNNGVLTGASPTVTPALTCAATANDVWYSFVATKPTHTFSLSNISPAGTTINFALYSGTCNGFNQLQCGATTYVANSLVIGQTYYVRVYTTASTNTAVSFSLCIGAVPCPEAVSLCNAPITYPNATQVINLGTYGCLGTSPNASFFFLEAAQSGSLSYTINQVNTAGNPIDVDYALWGPFASRDAGCILIPNGSPISCSFSAAATENFTITVTAGQIYILMVTNYANQAGSVTMTPNPTNTAQSFCYPYNTFNYSAVTYCSNSANQTPVLIAGAVPGIYSATPAGLTINSVTGEINFATSAPGTYTVSSTLIPTLSPPATNAPIICTRTVIVTPNPNATIAYSSPSYCNSDSVSHPVVISGIAGPNTTFSSTPSGLQYALDPISGTITPTLASPGVYTVTISVPAQGGCSAYTNTTTVEIKAAPQLPIKVDVNGCNSYTLPALTMGTYYTGSNATGTQLNAGDVITTTQVIYVYATNTDCASQVSFKVNIITIPTPTPSITSQPSCITPSGTMQVTSPLSLSASAPTDLFISEVTDANTGALSYVELFNGTGSAKNLANYRLKMHNNGNVTPTWQQTLSGTIANNSTFIIKISNDPGIPGIVHNLLIANQGIDTNDNIRLTTLANVELDMWGPTTGTVFTPNNQPGYTYRRLATSTPLPTTTWTPTQWTSFDPENYSNIGQYSLFVSNYEYAVDGGTFQSSTIFTGLAPGSHTLIVHDIVNDCYSSPSSFTVDPVTYTNAVTEFSYTTPVCITSTTNPTPTLASGFTTGGTFSYVGTGLDLNSTDGTIILASSTAGTYVITYTYPINLLSCINAGSSSFTITITGTITPTFTQIPSVCQNTTAPTLPLSSSNTPPITGTWNAPISTSSIGTTTYTFTPDPGQCGVSTTMDITVTAPNITPVFTQIPNICQNTTAPVLPTVSNNTPPVTGTWNAAINTSTPGTTTYTFTPNSGQCAVVTTMDITITAPNITPVFTQIPNICQSTTAPVLPTVSNNTPPITGTWNATINTSTPGTTTYTFTPNSGQCAVVTTMNITITVPNITPVFTQIPNICQNTTAPVLPLSSNNTPPVTGTWNAAINTSTPGTTTYTFTPNSGQCAVVTTMNITINSIVTPTFNAIATICQNEAAPALPTLSNNTTPISGTWNPSVINTSNVGTSNYVFTPNTGQCSQAVTKSITIEPRITPAFDQIQPLCVGDASVTLPVTSINTVSGIWSPAVVDTTVESNLVYTFTPDTSECASVVTMNILVEQCQIQKGISPNGDGLNDFLELVAKKVEIFNRYGKEVYSKENYNNDWHGQFMGGGEMPDGTYYFVIELVSGAKKTGWIYINREQK